MKFRYLSLEEAIVLHNDALGLPTGQRHYTETQIGGLASALAHIQDDRYYPDFFDKLAHLFFACAKYHPFLDGNKRTALYLSRAFILLNKPEYDLTHFYRDMEEAVVDAAAGRLSEGALKAMLKTILRR